MYLECERINYPASATSRKGKKPIIKVKIMLKNDARIEPLLGQYYYILNCPAPTVQYSTVLKSIYSIVPGYSSASATLVLYSDTDTVILSALGHPANRLQPRQRH